MAFFVNSFLGKVRSIFLTKIIKVQCYASGSWHDGVIDDKRIEDNAVIIDATFPVLNETATTVTAVRLIDVDNEECARQELSQAKKKGQGTFIRVKIPFTERGE